MLDETLFKRIQHVYFITLLGQIFAGRNFRGFSRFRDFFQEIRENFSRENKSSRKITNWEIRFNQG